MCQSSPKNKSRLEGTTISNGRIVSNINKRTHSFVRYHSPLTNFFTHKSFSCNCNHIQHTKFNSYQTKNLAILTHYFKTTLLMCGRIHGDFLGGKNTILSISYPKTCRLFITLSMYIKGMMKSSTFLSIIQFTWRNMIVK